MLEQKIKKFQVWQWLSLGLLSVAILLLFISPVIKMGFQIDNNYNEGWNAYHTSAVMSGQPLYNSDNELTPVNYPPLSFYIVGFLAEILGDPLVVGRYISLISLILISLGTGYAVKKLGGEIYDAVFASILCLGFFLAQGRAFVGANDPQILAHVFVLGGLLIYIQSPKKSRRLFLVALLISIGLFIKHNLLPIPVAVTADLLLNYRRSLFKWISYLALILGSFTLITQITAGADFLNHLTIGRLFSLDRLVSNGKYIGIRIIAPLLITLGWGIYAFFKEQKFQIISIYLAVSVFMGFFMLGGAGTNVNMLFDAFLAISIAAGLLLWYLRTQTQGSLKIRVIIYPIISFSLGLGIFGTTLKNIVNGKIIGYSVLKPLENISKKDIAFLANKEGPALCERMLLCYYAKKPLKYDPFVTTQLVLTGKIKEKTILSDMESGYYSVIQLEQKLDEQVLKTLPNNYVPKAYSKNERFTENFMRALSKYYMLVRQTENGAFYVPKRLGYSGVNLRNI